MADRASLQSRGNSVLPGGRMEGAFPLDQPLIQAVEPWALQQGQPGMGPPSIALLGGWFACCPLPGPVFCPPGASQ